MTAFDLAQRYVGIRELSGEARNHPLIVWWLSLCGFDPINTPDEVPWCSAFVNGICWELRLPRSKSAAARSWLAVGRPILLDEAHCGYDIVVLRRGTNPQAGHVGWFGGAFKSVTLLGGNQANGVGLQEFSVGDVLGVRRLQE